ncbi:YibE/F family protein [Actinoplanes sp. TFC3]|uniref:YibE/F family protein n=1 Tax=Actinoplanes sp. TFC3 TaxID=1710355 RepID=UPI00082E5B0E|nr:YibE/F family protein [Actinoplanes sp. TFC3]
MGPGRRGKHAVAAQAHVHAHGAAPAASRHTRRLVTAVLIPLAALTVLALILLWPAPAAKNVVAPGSTSARVPAEVISVSEKPCPAVDPGTPAQGRPRRCGQAVVRLTGSAQRGTAVAIALPQDRGLAVHVGDRIELDAVTDAATGRFTYSYRDFQRSHPMMWLIALTLAVVLAFGRGHGLAALGGLVLSFAVLLYFVIPAILDGRSPLLIAVVGSAAIMLGALYLTHGVNVHTSVAVAGTLVSLVITGVLGALFTTAMHLSGIASDDTAYLSTTRDTIDMRGLLLAGIVIGALGVLDDVTVTQAVTVAELAAARPRSRRELYRSAIRIGRAHVGSAVNTIVLAYAGTSLPLLLLVAVSPQPLTEMLTSEFLAQEILRSAVGTAGLVASVPITTVLAAMVAGLGATEPRH